MTKSIEISEGAALWFLETSRNLIRYKNDLLWLMTFESGLTELNKLIPDGAKHYRELAEQFRSQAYLARRA